KVVWTITDLCETFDVEATWKLNAPAALEIITPSDYDGDACQTQEAINDKFENWLMSGVVNGGCDSKIVTIDKTVADAPSACGGSVTVTWKVVDLCETKSASATFSVKPDVEAPVLECPPSDEGSDSIFICNPILGDNGIPVDVVDKVKWTDNCAGEGYTEGYDDGNGVTYDNCTYSLTRTFSQTDNCNNTGTCSVTYTWTIDEYDNCETMFARNGDDALCFLKDNDGNGSGDFNRWGWTNLISQGTNYTMDLHAGAAHCNATEANKVGTATVNYSDNGEITVQYELDPGYAMNEAHVYVGCKLYPEKGGKKGGYTVAPGQYNYNPNSGLDYLDDFTVGPIYAQGDVYIIIHGVVCEEVCRCSVPDPDTYVPDASSDDPAGCGEVQPSVQVEAVDFTAYPVPFDSEVTLKYSFEYETDVKVEVFDMKGTLIRQDENTSYAKGTVGKTKLNLSGTDDQLLLVRMSTSKGVVTKKIVSSGSAK
ncbi:T9SS type A sorting domain-containing protein, partial [uncultured Algibacter sp.]|uniref:T9SS type A sorting domain-containing protein n=1 Tax=uncultured Algibacter sp. TaxID=298659 RepID=UPI00260AAAE3